MIASDIPDTVLTFPACLGCEEGDKLFYLFALTFRTCNFTFFMFAETLYQRKLFFTGFAEILVRWHGSFLHKRIIFIDIFL